MFAKNRRIKLDCPVTKPAKLFFLKNNLNLMNPLFYSIVLHNKEFSYLPSILEQSCKIPNSKCTCFILIYIF